MAETTPQNYGNHAKFVPMFHYVAAPILLVNLGVALYRAVTGFSGDTVLTALVAVALLIIGLFARIFALGAQDRTIRLEERLRLHELLPDDKKPRINDIETSQLVALRFASDDELPGLVDKVLSGELTDQKSIKQAVSSWRADHQRL